MRELTDSDLDFFANVMPEWCGKSPEQGRKAATEWRRIRSEEEHEKRVEELMKAVSKKLATDSPRCMA